MANSDIVEDMEVVLRIALSQVAPDAALTSKRMFGGAGFFAYGKIFAAWFGTDRLAIKLSEDDREELLGFLQPVQAILTGIPEIGIGRDDAAQIRHGQGILLMPHLVERWRAERAGDDRSALVTCDGEAVALGEVRAGRFEPARVFAAS